MIRIEIEFVISDKVYTFHGEKEYKDERQAQLDAGELVNAIEMVTDRDEISAKLEEA